MGQKWALLPSSVSSLTARPLLSEVAVVLLPQAPGDTCIVPPTRSLSRYPLPSLASGFEDEHGTMVSSLEPLCQKAGGGPVTCHKEVVNL